ncbi:MAG: hypothetical protein IKZ63_03500, partial [Oscillospiraceae bacterium]|nr:hypothetical protein [Oscillospiraceae bacterium]
YGGRISSVLEVRSRDGNSKKVQGSLGIGLLTSVNGTTFSVTYRFTDIYGNRIWTPAMEF